MKATAKSYKMTPYATATIMVCSEEDLVPEDIFLLAKQAHDAHKEHARKTYLANGSHPRDHADTLKHNRDRRGQKLYNMASRNKKRKNDAKREFQAEIDLVFGNYHHGLGYVDDPELFYNAGYDAGYDDGYAAASNMNHEETTPETPMPWENMDLVLYMFDDAAKFVCQHERYKEKYETEVELMRAAFKNGVHKLNTATHVVAADIIFYEDVLYLLLGRDGYAYMQQQSLHHLVETVGHNLYALSEQPGLYQYYLELLQNRNANCK